MLRAADRYWRRAGTRRRRAPTPRSPPTARSGAAAPRPRVEHAIEVVGKARCQREEMSAAAARAIAMPPAAISAVQTKGSCAAMGSASAMASRAISSSLASIVPSPLASAACSKLRPERSVEPCGCRRCGRLGDVLEHQQFGEGGDRRRAHGEQRHEQHGPSDRAALIGDRAGDAASTSRLGSAAVPSARQRNSMTKSVWLKAPNGSQERLGLGFGCAPGRAGVAGLWLRPASDPAVISRVVQRRQSLAIGQLRRRQIGQQDRDDDQRHGEADRADKNWALAGPGQRPHAAQQVRRW